MNYIMHQQYKDLIISLHEDDIRNYIWTDKTKRINYYCKLYSHKMMKDLISNNKIAMYSNSFSYFYKHLLRIGIIINKCEKCNMISISFTHRPICLVCTNTLKSLSIKTILKNNIRVPEVVFNKILVLEHKVKDDCNYYYTYDPKYHNGHYRNTMFDDLIKNYKFQ